MTERRFSEEEVAEIFERATQSQQGLTRQRAGGDGMTLAELKDIGREVGIDATLVEQAARSLDVAGRPVERKLMGFPVGVGRTVELPRKLTDDEWERLVVDLRETFDARGRVHVEGNLRSWNNGNLQALLEPTSTGHRLRLKTLNAAARTYIGMGSAFIIGGFATFVMRALGSGLDAGWIGRNGTILAIGAAMFAFGALRLPSWARLRRKQMEDVSARLVQTVAERP